jgi:hypothetical protein
MADPSTGNAIARMLYRMFSGYVHGAYVHVMELHPRLGTTRCTGPPSM